MEHDRLWCGMTRTTLASIHIKYRIMRYFMFTNLKINVVCIIPVKYNVCMLNVFSIHTPISEHLQLANISYVPRVFTNDRFNFIIVQTMSFLE